VKPGRVRSPPEASGDIAGRCVADDHNVLLRGDIILREKFQLDLHAEPRLQFLFLFDKRITATHKGTPLFVFYGVMLKIARGNHQQNNSSTKEKRQPVCKLPLS